MQAGARPAPATAAAPRHRPRQLRRPDDRRGGQVHQLAAKRNFLKGDLSRDHACQPRLEELNGRVGPGCSVSSSRRREPFLHRLDFLSQVSERSVQGGGAGRQIRAGRLVTVLGGHPATVVRLPDEVPSGVARTLALAMAKNHARPRGRRKRPPATIPPHIQRESAQRHARRRKADRERAAASYAALDERTRLLLNGSDPDAPPNEIRKSIEKRRPEQQLKLAGS